MGIPRFYRWLSERYPRINENIAADQIPEFDNLYLDMNGIIHNCSHNNTGGLCVADEGEVFLAAFKYITRLFHIIRPKKLLYMAVDGCAPRAKMNQQRSRRFRAANDAREGREQAEQNGEVIDGTPFDSNCITPGTEFMSKLTEHLRFFICMKVQEDPLWQDVTIVLSGPDEPGEGEHKIMDYIRTTKAQPGYPPNLRHCLYGLDADLIMLSLASHEPHFALLREEVVFGKRTTEVPEARVVTSKDRFQLLHTSLLREYMELEFNVSAEREGAQFKFSVERVIDDFILFCVLVGNDFLPSLPFAEIGEGGLQHFFEVYKEHLRSADCGLPPWLTHGCGEVDFAQFARFLQRYGAIEFQMLEGSVDEGNWLLGRRRTVGPSHAPDPEGRLEGPLEGITNAEEARAQWYEVKFGMDINTHTGTQDRRKLLQSYLEGLQWVMYYYFRGPNAASWSWFYPFYHAPFAQDLHEYDLVNRPQIVFDVGEPFLPFQQLMAVLPANSKTLLPECFQPTFESPASPILDFYPQKFDIDVDGVKVPWGGVTLIPFIAQHRLLAAMAEAEQRGPPLSEAERRRNRFGVAHSYRFDTTQHLDAASPMPHRYSDLKRALVLESVFKHPEIPPGVLHFNNVPSGFRRDSWGFPTLHVHPLTSSFESGIKVFQFESRGKSLVVTLKPNMPAVPQQEAIDNLLRTRYIRIDYPFAHWGSVVAVHTAGTTFSRRGPESNNPRDHEAVVRQLVQEQWQKGLSLDFPSATGNGRGKKKGKQTEEYWQFALPVVEIRPAESSYIDADGNRQHQFRSESNHYLMHLVREDREPASSSRVSGSRTTDLMSDRFPVGVPVLCVDPSHECFGDIGRVMASNDEVMATFVVSGQLAQEATLQRDLFEIAQKQQQSQEWRPLQEIAQLAGVSIKVGTQILGSLMARSMDGVREDLGMNMMCEARESQEALCLPCYSMKKNHTWLFSDLAVEALKDYRDRFPQLFKALAERSPPRRGQWQRDFEMRFAFPDARDLEYSSRSLVKYASGAPWKKLKLAPGNYSALEPTTVANIDEAVQRSYTSTASAPTRESMVQGASHLLRPLDAGTRPPKAVMPKRHQMRLGQRGSYVKPFGLLPFGAKGTVIGVYGRDAETQLEVLLDHDSFSGTDRQGRTPAMRGVQVPLEAFMSVRPTEVQSTLSSQAPVVAPAAAKGSKMRRSAPPAEAGSGTPSTLADRQPRQSGAPQQNSFYTTAATGAGHVQPVSVPEAVAVPEPALISCEQGGPGEQGSRCDGVVASSSSSCPVDSQMNRPANGNKIRNKMRKMPAMPAPCRSADVQSVAASPCVVVAPTPGVADDDSALRSSLGPNIGAARRPACGDSSGKLAAPGQTSSKSADSVAGNTYYSADAKHLNWNEAFQKLLRGQA